MFIAWFRIPNYELFLLFLGIGIRGKMLEIMRLIEIVLDFDFVQLDDTTCIDYSGKKNNEGTVIESDARIRCLELTGQAQTMFLGFNSLQFVLTKRKSRLAGLRNIIDIIPITRYPVSSAAGSLHSSIFIPYFPSFPNVEANRCF